LPEIRTDKIIWVALQHELAAAGRDKIGGRK
jgi:hypothetical protein